MLVLCRCFVVSDRVKGYLRPPLNQSRGFQVCCDSHHPTMEPTSQVCWTFRPTTSSAQDVYVSGQTARLSFVVTLAPDQRPAPFDTKQEKREEVCVWFNT